MSTQTFAIIGKIPVKIEREGPGNPGILKDGGDAIHFFFSDNTHWVMWHEQDCCENVYIEDICGDFKDLLNAPLVTAYSTSNQEKNRETGNTTTWTFYNFSGGKGSVTIRWCGESNGYYSESVTFEDY